MDRTLAKDNSPDVRGLKALVIGLGVLIVLGTALVIGVVVKRIVESTGGPVVAAPAKVTAPVRFRTVLPARAGAAIAGVATAGGSIAIWVRDPNGGHVVLIDPQTGAVAGTVALHRPPHQP